MSAPVTHRPDTAPVSRPSRRSWRTIAAAVASVVLVGGLAQTLPVAAAAEPTSSRASGIEIIDIDGGTLLAPTPVSLWTGGDDVTGRSDATGDVLRLNTTRTTGIETVAGAAGASATVESAEVTLRDRVPVSLTGMSVRCSPDGTSELSFTSLVVDGTDITAEATATPGFSYALPESIYGSTRLVVGERTTDAAGVVTLTGLRVEAEAGASEIWRVRIGQVSCAPGDLPVDQPTDEPTDDGDPEVQPDPSVPAEPGTPGAPATTVTGVRVVAQDGTVLVDDQPQVTTGSETADAVVASEGYPSRASDVSVAALPGGGATVSVGEFTQVPDAGVDPVAEFRWGALRVYGLQLDVAADGSSAVSFESTSSAVFVNGVWINVGTDLYTGVGADGEPRVLVHLNERVTNPDGSTTITALRYEDLTGTYPDVSLGTVTLVPAEPGPVDPGPVDPDPGVEEPVLPRWHAYGVQATGPSAVPASPLATAVDASPVAESAASVSDGLSGQVSVQDVAVDASSTSAAAAVGSVDLYPQTRAAVSLTGLRVVITPDGAVVTSEGGTVLGESVAPGAIAPGTVVELEGTGLRVVLNEQTVTGEDTTVTGVRLTDTSGMRTDVQVAVVTTLAPTVVPTDPTDPTVPAVPSDPSVPTAPVAPDGGLAPGALVPDGTSPEGTSGGAPLGDGAAGDGAAQVSAPLASTGAQVRDGLVLAAGLLVVGTTGVLAARRRGARRGTDV